MDPVTILIAKFVGPVVLAVGLGIFFSRNYYTKVYRNLESETLAVFMGGITILIAGIAIVLNHNVWTTFEAGVISFIGWASIAKGLLLVIAPKTVDMFGDMVADSKFFPVIAFLATLCGGYLSYIAYIM